VGIVKKNIAEKPLIVAIVTRMIKKKFNEANTLAQTSRTRHTCENNAHASFFDQRFFWIRTKM